MKKMVSENIHDFINREEVDPELSAIEAIEDDEFSADENGEESIDYEVPTDEIIQTIRSEISISEYSRKSLSIMFKDGLVIDGVPMAELDSGDFLFKIDGQIEKIRLNQIIGLDFTPDSEEIVNEGYGEYGFTDYLYDISNFIEASVPDWNIVLVREDDQNLVNWLEENQDLWDLQSLFAAGVSSEDVALQILEESQKDPVEE